MNPKHFRELVLEQGHDLYRQMPWREEPTFYNVLVSEIMLQQTQVERVRVKFSEFMERFSTIEQLAAASLADVLSVWVGLGYNRRAKYLHEAARHVVAYGQPCTFDELIKLPGVGRNTAAAIMNYVYQVPTAFVETNIRTVYFKHFFKEKTDVSDREILAHVEVTMDREHPREFFWALMDYGTWLKREGQASLTMSRHYRRQSPLAGSVRQVRGQIIRALTKGSLSKKQLEETINTDGHFQAAIAGLARDGLIIYRDKKFHLTK